jgi:hypothetical protein
MLTLSRTSVFNPCKWKSRTGYHSTGAGLGGEIRVNGGWLDSFNSGYGLIRASHDDALGAERK